MSTSENHPHLVRYRKVDSVPCQSVHVVHLLSANAPRRPFHRRREDSRGESRRGQTHQPQFRRGLYTRYTNLLWKVGYIFQTYRTPPENSHIHGRRTIWRCISHLEWLWSVVMLVYWRVSPQINAKNLPIHEMQKCSDFVNPCLAPCLGSIPIPEESCFWMVIHHKTWEGLHTSAATGKTFVHIWEAPYTLNCSVSGEKQDPKNATRKSNIGY